MSRRRLLLSLLANNYKWLPYSFEYLYHNLIPSELPTFNVFDDEMELGAIDSTTGQNSIANNRLRCKNYIKVQSSLTYYFYCINFNTSVNGFLLYTYDSGKNFISYSIQYGGKFILPNNCCYIRFAMALAYGTTYNHDICINISNPLLNGKYAPYRPKQVKDQTRLVKISGNSRVRNQLAINTKLSFTTTDTNGKTVSNPFSLNANHKYFIFVKQSTTLTSAVRNTLILFDGSVSPLTSFGTGSGTFSINTWENQNLSQGIKYCFFDCSTSFNGLIQYWCNTPSSNVDIEINITDLTKEFPFDTPTSINDPRVQSIIAQGYKQFNQGEIKDTIVESIDTRGFNIWDEEWENGFISTSNGTNQIANDGIRSKNYIEVLSNENYYLLSSFTTSSQKIYLYFYDNNKNFISYVTLDNAHSGNGYGKGLFNSGNAKYVRFASANQITPVSYNHDICINRSSSRNGEYVPHRWQDFYQKVEYIESTGTQYIDSGIALGNTWAFDIKFLVVSLITDTRILTQTNYGLRMQDSLLVNFCQSKRYVYTATTNVVYSCQGNNTSLVVNGVNGTAENDSDTPSGNVRILFNTHSKLYYCKLYDNGVLVRDFIPVYRKSDMTIGLYDLVEGKFYENSGTGTFLKGNDIPNDNVINLPALLELAGVNNANNSFEITKENYVFTRKVFDYTFTGSESWIAYGSGYRAVVLSNAQYKNITSATIPTNVLSNTGFDLISRDSINNGVSGLSITGDTILVSSTSNLTGKKLTYELATPQVINIPRKHLKAVDLGKLNWAKFSGKNNLFQSSYIADMVIGQSSGIPHIYCSKYISDTDSNVYAEQRDKTITIQYGYNRLFIEDKSFNNATDFANAMSGIFLFYETENEVEDFVNEASCQRGGEINGNSFSWVENQIVKNGNFANGITDWISNNFSVSNGVGTFIADSQYSGVRQELGKDLISGHNYLLSIKTKCATAGIDITFGVGSRYYVYQNYILISSTVDWQSSSKIITYSPHGSDDNDLFVFDLRASGFDAISIKDVQVIDLTLAFGSGNEPTDVGDYRIKRIIEKGYIPTNTSGTYTSETCDVLPNVDMKFKCK